MLRFWKYFEPTASEFIYGLNVECGVWKKKGIKGGFKVIDLSNLKDGISIYWNGKSRSSRFGDIRIGFEGDQSFANQKLPFSILILNWLLRNKTQKEPLVPSCVIHPPPQFHPQEHMEKPAPGKKF